MPDSISAATLLVLVPLLPLVGALLTVALGRLLRGQAHLPAVAGIAASAVSAALLLGSLVGDVGLGRKGDGAPVAGGAASDTIVGRITPRWRYMRLGPPPP
jgi:hypothetical protein